MEGAGTTVSMGATCKPAFVEDQQQNLQGRRAASFVAPFLTLLLQELKVVLLGRDVHRTTYPEH